jgi:hypothetical protein
MRRLRISEVGSSIGAILRAVGGVLVFVLILVAIGGIAWYGWWRKQQRRESLHRFALQNGMEFAAQDPFGLTNLPFHLFSLGDGRGCENVMWGSWKGLPVREADYWYYTESTDSKGNRSRSYHRFSTVMAELPGSLPAVRVEKESVFSRIADHLGFQDITFESERFNRMYQVRAVDREFAFKLVDARMIAWLESLGGSLGFEVGGTHLLVWSGKRPATRLIPLFGGAELFRDHIPRMVWTEYGTGSVPGQAEERSPS